MQCPICQESVDPEAEQSDSTSCQACGALVVLATHDVIPDEPPTPTPWTCKKAEPGRFCATRPWRSAALVFFLGTLLALLALVTMLLAGMASIIAVGLLGAGVILTTYALAAAVLNRSRLEADAHRLSYTCAPLPFPMPSRVELECSQIRALAFVPTRTLVTDHGRSVQTLRTQSTGQRLDAVLADGTHRTMVPNVATQGQQRWLLYHLRRIGIPGQSVDRPQHAPH